MPLTESQRGTGMLTLGGVARRCLSAPDATVTEFVDFAAAQGIPTFTVDRPHRPRSVTRFGSGHKRSRLLVFALLAQDVGLNSLLANLKPVIRFHSAAAELQPWVDAAQAALEQERGLRPGFRAVAAKIVELLFINIVRHYVLTEPELHAAWMRGLRDRHIGRAITCIHNNPSGAWTVDSLAREAGLGRSTFARRFRALVGTSPGDYVIGR